MNEIIFVTPVEGALCWVPWEEWQKLRVPGPQGKRVHAIMFADGRVWDAYGGMRVDGPDHKFTRTSEEIKGYRQRWRELASDKTMVDALRQEHIIFNQNPVKRGPGWW